MPYCISLSAYFASNNCLIDFNHLGKVAVVISIRIGVKENDLVVVVHQIKVDGSVPFVHGIDGCHHRIDGS